MASASMQGLLKQFVIIAAIKMCFAENFGNEFNDWESERLYQHVVGRGGENCREACWSQGYSTCISSPGTTDQVVDMLYYYVPTGQISLWEAIWSEDYHPLIEASGDFVGWDVIPETGGKCDAYPPDFTQRRLCQCGNESCDDVFVFCRALRFVCGKYGYTRSMCHNTCGLCEDLGDSDPELFGEYSGEEMGFSGEGEFPFQP